MSSKLASFDKFTANSTLRLKQKSSSMNFYLGVISFLLLILFAVLLFTRINGTINTHESQIKFSQSQKRTNEGDNFDDFMFGIGFNSWMIPNISDYQNYFTMYVEYLSKNQSGMKLEILKPCTPDKWKKLGPDYQAIYNKYLLNETYCPENPINVNVVDITQDFLKIHFSDCLKKYNSNCKSQKQIQQTVFNQVRKNFSAFYIYLDFLVQTVEIHSQNPINYYVREQKIKIDLNYDSRNYSFLNIKKNIITDLEKYHIEFDNSRLSFYKDSQTSEGYVFGQFNTRIQNYTRCQFPKQYLLLQYAYSQKLKIYNRSYNTIDDIISDVGGLKEIIVGIFALFLGAFNQIRYQLTVAESSFNYNSDGKKIRRRDLNLRTYTKYYFYDLINIICYFEPNWTQTQKMVKTVQESKEILDAKNFFRKLTYLERVVQENLSQETIYLMSVTPPLSLKQVQEKRLLISYYESIINCEEAATVEDALAQSSDSFKYLKKSDSLLSSSIHRLYSNPEINQEPDQVQQKQKQKEKEKQMEQSFAKHLRLDLETCRSISKYPLIAEDAKKIELTEEQTEMEIKMTTRFLSLSSAKKREVIKKVPIIILHRLRMRAQSLQQQTFGESKLKIKDEKKITLKDIISDTSNTISQFDAFTTQPVLGANLSVQRGFHLIDIVNLVILVYLAYSLLSQLNQIATLDSTKLTIASYKQNEKVLNEVTNLMFAIKFQDNFTQQFGGSLGLMSNFVWRIEYLPNENTTISQKMVPCQPEMWSLLGDTSYRQFIQYKLDKAYCLKKNIQSLKPVQNKAFLKLLIQTCTSNSSNQTVDPTIYNSTHTCQVNETVTPSNISFCQSQNILSYYSNVTKLYRYFPIWIYNLVPQFTPHNKVPINYNIRMSRFTVLTNKSGYFNQYYNPKRVKTDSSIWPQIPNVDTVTKYETSTVYPDRFIPISQSKNGAIAQVNFYARPEILVFERKIKTIDKVLSSVGGIFGVFVGVIAFVFGSFYQKKFGLNVCESSFNFDSDGNKFSDDQLTGLKHIKFSLYSKFPCLKSCVSQKQQKQMKLMNQTLEEVDELLDIQKILKRLDFLERVIWKNEDPNYLSAIALIQHQSIAQISHKRMIIEYYQQIIQQKAAASVQDAVNKSSKSFNYLKKKGDKLINKNLIEQSQMIKQVTEKQLKMKQIQFSLINDLKIKRSIAQAISEYPEISDQAQKIELTPQWDEIETEITCGFIELNQKKKQKIMMKIPMIIIQRLRLKALKFKKYSQLMLKKKMSLEIQSIPESKNEDQTQMMIARKMKSI